MTFAVKPSELVVKRAIRTCKRRRETVALGGRWRAVESISFKGAIQSLDEFQPLIALQCERDAAFRQSIFEQLLDAFATHSVADVDHRSRLQRFRFRPFA